ELPYQADPTPGVDGKRLRSRHAVLPRGHDGRGCHGPRCFRRPRWSRRPRRFRSCRRADPYVRTPGEDPAKPGGRAGRRPPAAPPAASARRPLPSDPGAPAMRPPFAVRLCLLAVLLAPAGALPPLAAADFDPAKLALIRPRFERFVEEGQIAGAVTVVGTSKG